MSIPYHPQIAPCPCCTAPALACRHHLEFPDATIYACRGCGHWFASPEPDRDWLDRFYATTYSQWRHQYLGEEYYTLMQRRAQAQVAFMATRGVPGALLRSGRALDLGCGVGALVAALHRSGMQAIGYDSDADVLASGRRRWGIPLELSTPARLDQHHGQVDLLCLSHVVEHLAGVRDSLAEILELGYPGSYVFIEVPDCTVEQMMSTASTEAHLHFFSERSLRMLLDRLQLETLACESCGPPQVSYTATGKSTVQRLRARWNELAVRARRLGLPAPLTTIYDGYFATYHARSGQGIWLRCLARRT